MRTSLGEGTGGNGLGRGARRCRNSQIERRVAGEDGKFELLQPRAGLEPQLLGQAASERLVNLQRLRLPRRPVKGEHELAAQPLTQRVALSEFAELRHQVA